MEKERIKEGIIGESMAGEKVKCFISVMRNILSVPGGFHRKDHITANRTKRLF
jgi:hypothetical protein